jgi:tetratricopeptide (TPR) repeat protein
MLFFRSTKFILCSLFAFVCLLKLYPQSNQDSVISARLILLKDKKLNKFDAIDSIFRKEKRDTFFLRQLAIKSKAANNILAEGYALNFLGISYRNASLYDQAIELHKQSYELAQLADDIELQVVALNMIGVAYRRMDLVKPALDYHTQALDLANNSKNKTSQLEASIAVSQNSIGNIYLALKRYDLAINQFMKSLKIEEKLNQKLGLAINYHNIGYAQEAMGNYKNAMENYQRSLMFNNDINSDVGRVICYNSIGSLEIKLGRLNEAREIIEQALSKSIDIGDQFYIATSYNNLGWVNLELKEFEIAKEYLEKALETSIKYNLTSSSVEAHKKLSELYEQLGEHQPALYHYKTGIDMENTITNERNFQYVNDIVLEYENEVKNKQIQLLADRNEELLKNQKLYLLIIFSVVLLAVIMIALNRNRQLRQEKQILTLEQDMLRSQMNPHFIFNSLNSIKHFIINNDQQNAVYYLNKFAKLIRKILVSNTEKHISLEDELETMKLYLSVENMRFSNQIDFLIDIDPSINTSAIKVPSLILQPFLENALWHGLSSKADDKKIKLEVSKGTKNHVAVTITDNGIGRVESEKINRDKSLNRKSVGLNITKARLSNFSKRFTTDYNLTITDLYDQDQKATGTKVELHIPTDPDLLKSP